MPTRRGKSPFRGLYIRDLLPVTCVEPGTATEILTKGLLVSTEKRQSSMKAGEAELTRKRRYAHRSDSNVQQMLGLNI